MPRCVVAKEEMIGTSFSALQVRYRSLLGAESCVFDVWVLGGRRLCVAVDALCGADSLRYGMSFMEESELTDLLSESTFYIQSRVVKSSLRV